MKKLILMSFLAAAALLVSCDEKGYIPNPGDYQYEGDPKPLKFQVGDTTGFGVQIPADALSPKEANAICRKLGSGETTKESYYIVGFVKGLNSKYTDNSVASFYMVDYKNPYSADVENQFYAFKVQNIGGTAYESAGYGIVPGDAIVIQAKLTNYNGTLESAQNGQIIATSFKEAPVETVGDGSAANPYTVADVLALRNKKKGYAYVRGFIIGTALKDGDDNSINAANMKLEAPFDVATNVVLADVAGSTEFAKMIPVEVPGRRGDYKEIHEALNLYTNPGLVGAEVLIYGSLEKYISTPGVMGVTYAEINGTPYGTKK